MEAAPRPSSRIALPCQAERPIIWSLQRQISPGEIRRTREPDVRKAVFAIVTFALALTAIVALLVATLDIERYREPIEARASQAIGRTVELAGPMSLGLALHPTLIVEQVSVANPDWASRPHLATFERIEATMALLPLLARRIEVDRLILSGADIGLERAADGRPNWRLVQAAADPGAGSPARAMPATGRAQASETAAGASSVPFVREVRIHDSRITYRDAARDIEHGLRLVEAHLAAKGTASPVGIDLSGELDGRAMSLRGEVGAVAALLEGAGPYPLDLRGKALGLELELTGTAGMRGDAPLDLQATVTAPDAAALQAAAGPYLEHAELLEGSGPLRVAGRLRGTTETPAIEGLEVSGRLAGLEFDIEGAVRDLVGIAGLDLAVKAQGDPVGLRALVPAWPAGALSASAKITGEPSALVVDELKLQQGDSDLGGRLTVAADGQRPSISGELTSQRLSLPAGVPRGGGDADKGRSGRQPLFSDTPFDLTPLRAVDADIGLQVARLLIGAIEVEEVDLRAKLVAGALTIDGLEASLAGSPFEGSMMLDTGGEQPNLRLELGSRPLDLGALLAELGVTDLVQVQGRLRVDVRATGASPQALARSLAGRADAVFADGRINAEAVRQPIVGLQRFFGALLAPLRSDWVALSCIAARFAIEDGVARPEVLFIDSAVSSAVGTGKIDIGRERYALTITPSPKGIDLGVGLPIRITGPLIAPKIGLDEKGAVAGVGALVGKLLFPPALIAGMIDVAGKDSPCVRSVEAAGSSGRGRAPSSAGDAASEVLEGLGRGLQELLPR
jgi:uncharacterized protein involved in outer membrane biogenesis